MTRISDSAMQKLREVAQELLDAQNDAESHEAVRAFLCGCHNDGVMVDEAGELAPVAK
ncbi:MAG: hypothetical protein ACREQ5_06770 [Candidatus Dormibacteria bacterium]